MGNLNLMALSPNVIFNVPNCFSRISVLRPQNVHKLDLNCLSLKYVMMGTSKFVIFTLLLVKNAHNFWTKITTIDLFQFVLGAEIP